MIALNRITEIKPKQLIGMHEHMSFMNNTTTKLWQRFMPRRKEIASINNDLYSLQIYPADFFEPFNPATVFTKYALMEVNDANTIPQGMELFILPPGSYAVFDYKGNASEAAPAYQYIFTTWLPVSGYAVDNRPHFEMLGEKYKRDSDDSEEEIWIPVRKV